MNLSSEEGHVLDDGEPDPPLGVLGQLHDGGEEGLAQLLDTDHFVHAVQVRNYIQANLEEKTLFKSFQSINQSPG